MYLIQFPNDDSNDDANIQYIYKIQYINRKYLFQPFEQPHRFHLATSVVHPSQLLLVRFAKRSTEARHHPFQAVECYFVLASFVRNCLDQRAHK